MAPNDKQVKGGLGGSPPDDCNDDVLNIGGEDENELGMTTDATVNM